MCLSYLGKDFCKELVCAAYLSVLNTSDGNKWMLRSLKICLQYNNNNNKY